MIGSLLGNLAKSVGNAAAGVIGDGANAATRFAQTTAEGLKEVTTTVTQCAETMADGLQSVATRTAEDVSHFATEIGLTESNVVSLNDTITEYVNNLKQQLESSLASGPKQSDVLEKCGEALAKLTLSGKEPPSKEDFLKAINIVLPQYQQDMSKITTDVKVYLASSFEYTTTQFETKTDSSSPAHNPTKNQLEQTTKDDMVNNITCGAFGGGVAGACAGGPGGAAAGAAIGGSLGAVKAVVQSLLVKIIKEAKTQRIIRKDEMQKIN